MASKIVPFKFKNGSKHPLTCPKFCGVLHCQKCVGNLAEHGYRYCSSCAKGTTS